MSKSNILKRVLLSLVGIAIFLIGMLLGNCSCNASSKVSVANYESTIEENNIEIKQCEIIKESLHKLAQETRRQKFYDSSFVESLSAKWHSQNEYQKTLELKNEELKDIIDTIKKQEPKYKYIGDFKITYYCIENYRHICNNGNASITATGTVPTPGRTIAVDPKKIPYGTKVIVDGHTYIAEDTGGAIKGNKLDICVATHGEALHKGVKKNVPVYIVEE